jgi:hypothetical protein
MRALLTLVLATAALGLPHAAAAQVFLTGRVVDEDTSLPITGVRVVLLDNSGRHVASRGSDDDGAFHFSVRREGPYQLRASRIGYQETTTPRLWLGEHQFVEVELRLHPDAVLLAPLEVVARSPSTRTSAVLDGFYTRHRSSAAGIFITREEIEQRRPAFVSDLLATVPGVHLVSAGRGTRRAVYMSRAIGREACPAQIFVDGFLFNRRLGMTGVDPGLVIDDAVNPGSVEGIEIYKGIGGVPAEFLNPDSRCGVVAIWTRRGGAR